MKELNCDALFNDSFEYINSDDFIFYDVFYQNFIASSVEVSEVFVNTDIKTQQEMLRHAIVNMVNFFVTRQADEYLIRMARNHHVDHPVKIGLFDNFIEALLLTLSTVYPRYTEAVGLAWRITLAPGIEFMKHAHKLEAKSS